MFRTGIMVIVLTAAVFLAGCGGSKVEETRESPDMLAGNILLEKADSVFSSGAYEESRDMYIHAARQAEASGDSSVLTEAYAQIARTFLIVGRKEDGRQWLGKAGRMAKPDDKLGWSRFLGVRGRFEWQDGESGKATATFKEMYGYSSNRGLHERAVDAAHMVAITGTPEMQIEWGKRGIAEAEAGNVTGWLGPLWNNLGATYEDMGRYPECLGAYLKAREYHHKYGGEANRYIADWAVGHAYRLVDSLDQAEEWLTRTLEWCETAESAEFVGWCRKDLGEIELARGNYGGALGHLVTAEEKLKAEGMADWDAEGYSKLVDQIEEIRGKLEQ